MKLGTVGCQTGAITDTVEQPTTGATSLRYTGGQFVQNLKTPTALGCYRALVQLVSRDTIAADFKILK